MIIVLILGVILFFAKCFFLVRYVWVLSSVRWLIYFCLGVLKFSVMCLIDVVMRNSLVLSLWVSSEQVRFLLMMVLMLWRLLDLFVTIGILLFLIVIMIVLCFISVLMVSSSTICSGWGDVMICC